MTLKAKRRKNFKTRWRCLEAARKNHLNRITVYRQQQPLSQTNKSSTDKIIEKKRPPDRLRSATKWEKLSRQQQWPVEWRADPSYCLNGPVSRRIKQNWCIMATRCHLRHHLIPAMLTLRWLEMRRPTGPKSESLKTSVRHWGENNQWSHLCPPVSIPTRLKTNFCSKLRPNSILWPRPTMRLIWVVMTCNRSSLNLMVGVA